MYRFKIKSIELKQPQIYRVYLDSIIRNENCYPVDLFFDLEVSVVDENKNWLDIPDPLAHIKNGNHTSVKSYLIVVIREQPPIGLVMRSSDLDSYMSLEFPRTSVTEDPEVVRHQFMQDVVDFMSSKNS